VRGEGQHPDRPRRSRQPAADPWRAVAGVRTAGPKLTRAITEAEIGRVIAAFARAAELSVEAGFDAVELTSATATW
jgi:2,4-dienoyl-CoA reductase-like NADH-dependent reductase (Old Yellow Enzyme family)